MPAQNARAMELRNIRLAKAMWPALSQAALQKLRFLIQETSLSIAAGDVTYLEHGWYVTHAGLLRIARKQGCAGIDVRPLSKLCDAAAHCYEFKATVYKSRTCRGFVGYGDADPSNVAPHVRGAEMRIAETRAVDRALRKAYGIGTCSVEERGSFSGPLPPPKNSKRATAKAAPIDGNGCHPLRDRLCLLIRQHQLDPALVKAYAAEYCDVSELRQASREQVASFIKHLADYAQNDREGLLYQLNSYAPKPICPAPAPKASETPGAEQEKAAGAA